MAKTEEHYDVVVMGGGPGGAISATFLAMAKRRVLVLEREKFPRFHIGESLLPFGNKVLKDAGVWDKIEAAGFMPKRGAEFCTGNSKKFHRFWFAHAVGKDHDRTFQVERSQFDHLLLRHAEEKGAVVREESKVVFADPSGRESIVEYQRHNVLTRVRCRWIIDATGRDTVMGKMLNLPRQEHHLPKRIATYAHYSGVFRNAGEAAGHITIVRLQEGWFWLIPLDEDKTSVGFVQLTEALKKSGLSPADRFEQVVIGSSEMQSRMKGAQRIGGVHTTSDYSYRYREMAGPHWLLVGDSAGFIDPIFSSGVMMAMQMGQQAAKTLLEVESCGGHELSKRQRSHYTREAYRAMDTFAGMIRRFYCNRAFEVFMNPAPWLRLPLAVNNILAGRTRLDPSTWIRVRLFYLLAALQKYLPISPRVDFTDARPVQPDVSLPARSSAG